MPKVIGNIKHYTVDEVSVCANEVYHTSLKKVNEGKIKSIEINRQKLITHESLVSYMKSLNLPESIIDYRLGIKSPKTGRKLHPQEV